MAATPTHSSEQLDLTRCDLEPIHTPGSIQPHGFLLALDQDEVVRVASRNAAAFLGVEPAAVIGQKFEELLGSEQAESLAEAMNAELPQALHQMLAACTLSHEPQLAYDVIAYRSAHPEGAMTCIEYEPVRHPADPARINARLYNFVASIRRMSNTADVYAAAVQEVRALTGCDRVLLYRFNEEGHGVVMAEEREPDRFSSYLHLRFPASDVPKQARRLYEVNRIRIIPNVEYEASPLENVAGPEGRLDLTGSILRSVSPIHRQYMRNMGTACSMSVSLMIDGKLWGLISCHHRSASYISLRLRSACDFVAQIVASQIESQQNAARLQSALSAQSLQNRLMARMTTAEDPIEGLKNELPVLAELTGAAGVAVVSSTGLVRWGQTPDEEGIFELAAWLREHHADELFATDRMGALLPTAARYATLGSGVIATALSRLHSTQLLWFRPEVVHTMQWAGNPQKAAAAGVHAADLLTPRQSFAEWSEEVRGRAEAWSESDLAAASDFRAAALEVVLRRAEESAELAEELRTANEELDAFSYSVSHDLRAPFRHILGFSEMLRDEEAEHLSERGRHHLDTIMSSARFAGQLVDSLLEFARVGRSQLRRSTCSMDQMVDHEWTSILFDLEPTEPGARAVDFIRGDLPEVQGDAHLLRQVWRNLLDNARKYSATRDKPQVRVSWRRQGDEHVFAVADNGVGFDEKYAGKLFGVFQRLHRIEEFEGTGIGLANVRRIVSRHGGRVWAKGEVNAGATFFFTLPARSPTEESLHE